MRKMSRCGTLGSSPPARIEHYEIAAYAAVSNFDEIIGQTDQASLLERTLEEEKNAEAALGGIAESANTRADRAA